VNSILQYAPIVVVGLIVFLLDRTLGRLLDKITRRREAIRSEAIRAVIILGTDLQEDVPPSLILRYKNFLYSCLPSPQRPLL
jgi:hypothetical protein